MLVFFIFILMVTSLARYIFEYIRIVHIGICFGDIRCVLEKNEKKKKFSISGIFWRFSYVSLFPFFFSFYIFIFILLYCLLPPEPMGNKKAIFSCLCASIWKIIPCVLMNAPFFFSPTFWLVWNTIVSRKKK